MTACMRTRHTIATGHVASRPSRVRLCVRAAVTQRPSSTPTSRPEPPHEETLLKAPGLPYLGSYACANLTVRFKTAEKLMKESKARAMEMELLGRKFVVFRHPDDLATILRDPVRFPKIPNSLSKLEAWLGQGLVSRVDPVQHAAVREVLMPAFKAASVRGFVPTFARVGHEMGEVLDMMAGKTYDIEMLCRRATLDVIGRTGFGYDFKAVEVARMEAAGEKGQEQASDGAIGESYVDVVRMLDAILTPAMWLISDFQVPDSWLPGIEGYYRGIKLIDQVIDKMLQERRTGGLRDSDTDLLSFMLRAQQEGNAVMSDRQLRDELQTMILAGSDTTATTLAFALYELSRHPEVAEAAAKEVDAALGGMDPASAPTEVFQAKLPLIAGIANETLRLYPAAPESFRIVAEDVVVGGYALPEGTRVVPSMYAVHRNEEFWPRPDEWLPERWLPANAATMAPHADRAFVPFTVGPRSCIGRYFAVLELQVLATVLLQRFTFQAVPGFEAGTYQNFTLSSTSGILVVPQARPR